MYPNYVRYDNNQNFYGTDDERFLWAPFLFGGLAGTALGYGIANNQMNNQSGYLYPMYPVYPMYPIYPTYSSNSYYY